MLTVEDHSMDVLLIIIAVFIVIIAAVLSWGVKKAVDRILNGPKGPTQTTCPVKPPDEKQSCKGPPRITESFLDLATVDGSCTVWDPHGGAGFVFTTPGISYHPYSTPEEPKCIINFAPGSKSLMTSSNPGCQIQENQIDWVNPLKPVAGGPVSRVKGEVVDSTSRCVLYLNPLQFDKFPDFDQAIANAGNALKADTVVLNSHLTSERSNLISDDDDLVALSSSISSLSGAVKGLDESINMQNSVNSGLASNYNVRIGDARSNASTVLSTLDSISTDWTTKLTGSRVSFQQLMTSLNNRLVANSNLETTYGTTKGEEQRSKTAAKDTADELYAQKNSTVGFNAKVDCEVSGWSICENGKQTRRTTTYPQNGGKECPELEQQCYDCTVNWPTDWTTCVYDGGLSCGIGKQTQTQVKAVPSNWSSACPPLQTQERQCVTKCGNYQDAEDTYKGHYTDVRDNWGGTGWSHYNAYGNREGRIWPQTDPVGPPPAPPTPPPQPPVVKCAGADAAAYEFIGTNGAVPIGTSISQCKGLRSSNERFMIVLQSDGNFVLYEISTKKALWASNTDDGGATGPYSVQYQTDYNLVLYNASSRPTWHTATYNQPSTHFIMQDDGNAVIYNGSNPIWATNTAQVVPVQQGKGCRAEDWGFRYYLKDDSDFFANNDYAAIGTIYGKDKADVEAKGVAAENAKVQSLISDFKESGTYYIGNVTAGSYNRSYTIKDCEATQQWYLHVFGYGWNDDNIARFDEWHGPYNNQDAQAESYWHDRIENGMSYIDRWGTEWKLFDKDPWL